VEWQVERNPPTKQRVDDLHFFLFERTLHPELFEIATVKRVEQRRYQAEIWILQCAHAVTVHTARGAVMELIAPEMQILPKTGLATSFRFRGERDHVQALDSGMRYILSSQVERMTPQVFPSTFRELHRHAQRKGFFVEFGEPIDGMTAFSFVDFEARDHEFHVYAFHAFPSDLTLLKTQSILELGPEPRDRFG